MNYCQMCGGALGADGTCVACGARSALGQPTAVGAAAPVGYGAVPPDVAGKKLAAGLTGILLGALGIHKFVLGYTTEGLIMLLVSILTCGLGAIVFGVIGLVEGIIYLTKSDADFHSTYMVNKRGWF